jgi:hypothetical protein
MDPWQEMDDWCKAKADRISDEAWTMLSNGVALDHPDYRLKLGESGALHRMRSFIHSARKQAA